jgi:uncharacterized protein YndB with AHSA1/START domain
MNFAAALIVRRTIHASPERIFDAWTQPAHLTQWWGPKSVQCVAAEVDLSVGGRYRIANQFPDGKILWISGEFEAIDRPRRLAYTWRVGGEEGAAERVIVSFEARGEDTEVMVRHERIPTPTLRDMHEQGWFGCLDGLAQYLRRDP